jgi:DNA helicase-2/ATP-dependent DNA helicase PcrA
VLSGHAWHDSVKNPKKPSEFLATARDLDGVTIGTWIDDPGDKPDLMSFSIDGSDPDPLFAEGVEHALRAVIDDAGWVENNHPDTAGEVAERVAQLSLEIGELRQPVTESRQPPFATAVTNLVALAECPLKFKWIHYDKMPRRPSKAAADGTEFHRKVELHNLGKVPLDDAAPDRYDAVLADAEIDRSETSGSRSDPWTVFERSRFASTKSRFTEVPFEIAIGVGSIRGKIDAIYETEPGTWEIVDYKSGRASQNPVRRVQLQAYAIAAVDGAVSIDRPESMRVSFAYFGDTEVVEVTEHVDDDWMDEARADVERLVALGAEGPWEPKPSPSCRHCDFMIHCPAGQAWVQANDRS